MPTILVNPLNESRRPSSAAAPRLQSLKGMRIGLLDISKPGGGAYFDRLSSLLAEKAAVGEVIRETKPTFAKLAPEELIDKLVAAGCDAVIEALAD